ncbi:MAG: stage II sporulation protein M [Planctomycetes bacterium]|nr:stage II sporulation protein M [Planctomycetota bacterium]
MIIDLKRFLEEEQPFWSELDEMLGRIAMSKAGLADLDAVKRFHYLYERATADLARLTTFSSDRQTRLHLETLVARAYAEIHSTHDRPGRLRPLHWLISDLPRTFRRHWAAFALSLAATLAGVIFGSFALAIDPDAKDVVLPFGHLLGDPAERVKKEEQTGGGVGNQEVSFSAFLMTNNIKVSIIVLAMGLTFGIGTIVMLFYNGVILGAVVFDYIRAGQGKFLAGWLLPHGSFEIPAILIAGQAGLVLARALIGWSDRNTLKQRLRLIMPDLITLIGGVAVLLVWAGIVESFLSQYHEPKVEYWQKISLGIVQLSLLAVLLGLGGRRAEKIERAGP